MNLTQIFDTTYYFFYQISHNQDVPGIYIILLLFIYHFILYLIKGYTEIFKNNLHIKKINDLIIKRDNVNPEIDFQKYIHYDKQIKALKQQPKYVFPSLLFNFLSYFPSLLFYHVPICYFDSLFCFPFNEKTVYLPRVSFFIKLYGNDIFPHIKYFPNSQSPLFIVGKIMNYLKVLFPLFLK